MTEVKAGVEYKINIDGNSFLLDQKKFNLMKANQLQKLLSVLKFPTGPL